MDITRPSRSVFFISSAAPMGGQIVGGMREVWPPDGPMLCVAGVLLPETVLPEGCVAVAGVFYRSNLLLSEAIARGMPAIQFSNTPAEIPGVLRVVNDDVAIGRMGARYLLAQGYRRLFFLRREPGVLVEERWRGFSPSSAVWPTAELFFSDGRRHSVGGSRVGMGAEGM
jgi:hypothetical protein